eukprot:5478238-Karenia_brevis.AAC.1
MEQNRSRAAMAGKIVSAWTKLQSEWLAKAHIMEKELQDLCQEEELEKAKHAAPPAPAPTSPAMAHPIVQLALQA